MKQDSNPHSIKHSNLSKESAQNLKKSAIDEWLTKIPKTKKDSQILRNKLDQLESQERIISELDLTIMDAST